MPFQFIRTEISDVILVVPKVFPDDRGFFVELYKASDFIQNGMNVKFAQVNHSRSEKDVLRGLHYQLPPKAQAKLISVVRGEICDIAVDIRKGSPTYGRGVSAHLSDENKNMLFVPEGFAHGFCVLSDIAEIIYYCSEEYAPSLERNILWNDPALKIDWPVKIPLLSPKDAKGRLLSEAENLFQYGKTL